MKLRKIVTALLSLVSVSSHTSNNAETFISARGKGPEDDHNTFISLINATPYRWHKTYNNSHQVNWNKKWPEYIESGQSVTVYAKNVAGLRRQDAAAETTYSLEGTSKPASLQVQYRAGTRHEVYVQFLENLYTMNNAKYTEHSVGFHRDPGGVGFILAGTENDFISNDGPLDWMQQQLPEIGHLPLREICLPRSHNAGQWKNTEAIGVGHSRNTQCHKLELYHQLGNGGVRVLDVRAVMKHGKFHQAHGSFIGSTYNGMFGASLGEMVDQANQFMKDYPGELYIWDIHHFAARNGDDHYKPLDDDARKKLYDELKRINWRPHYKEDADLSRLPLSDLIDEKLAKSGRSVSLIRVPTEWASKKHFPGSHSGFFTGVNLPLKTRWSDTNKLQKLIDDQVKGLREARSSRKSEMYNMDWILTQQNIQVAFPMQLESIVEMSRQAWKALYSDLWGALTDISYPNLITMDNIHGNEQKAIVMAINKCLGARRCGKLGGMVTGAVNETIGPVHDTGSDAD